MRPGRQRAAARGFTLLEAMIAVAVMAFGLLGLAKVQALSVSNTRLSSTRSLIAFQASSLAAAMRGNRAFWSSGAAIAFSTSGTTVTDASDVLGTTAPDCEAAACSPAEMAAYDVQRWTQQLTAQFPQAVSSVNCAAGAPVNCLITVSWAERYVAMNAATAASAAALTATRTYTQVVLP